VFADEEPPAPKPLRTSLVWVFGDDDVTHAPAETAPPSPGAGIGDRPGYDSLFDGIASRYTGRENRSELRLDGDAPGLFPRLTTRAGLTLGFDLAMLGERPAPLFVEDLGSYLALQWLLGEARAGRANTLGVRLFPLNGDRERVGELEALAWGGAVGPHWSSPYAGASGPVRAGRLELALGLVRAHVGLKTAPFLEVQPAGPAVDETSYGVYGGVASRWSAPLRVALGFGHFEHGRLPGPAGAPRAATTGVSLALGFGSGLPQPRPPVAFMTDGAPFDRVTRPSKPQAFAVGVETAHLVERLWDFDHPGESVLAPARACAVLGEVVAGALDLRLAFTVRDPLFVVRNGPGVFPGQSLPRAAGRRVELGALASVSAVSWAGRVIPSLSAGVLAPAALETVGIARSGQSVGATIVVRGAGELELLPPGEVPVPVLDVRPSLELEFSRLLQGLVWLEYRRDFNRTHLVEGPDGAVARGFRGADHVGYGVAARAVW
jgi:hypothetical protein